MSIVENIKVKVHNIYFPHIQGWEKVDLHL